MGQTASLDYPEELPVGYYLDNFQTILDFVDSHYEDILSADEKSFSQSFRSLSVDARRLYVRLISRKGPLFRSDTLIYNEIADIEARRVQAAEEVRIRERKAAERAAREAEEAAERAAREAEEAAAAETAIEADLDENEADLGEDDEVDLDEDDEVDLAEADLSEDDEVDLASDDAADEDEAADDRAEREA